MRSALCRVGISGSCALLLALGDSRVMDCHSPTRKLWMHQQDDIANSQHTCRHHATDCGASSPQSCTKQALSTTIRAQELSALPLRLNTISGYATCSTPWWLTPLIPNPPHLAKTVQRQLPMHQQYWCFCRRFGCTDSTRFTHCS